MQKLKRKNAMIPTKVVQWLTNESEKDSKKIVQDSSITVQIWDP